jgi:hypothetical protein
MQSARFCSSGDGISMDVPPKDSIEGLKDGQANALKRMALFGFFVKCRSSEKQSATPREAATAKASHVLRCAIAS